MIMNIGAYKTKAVQYENRSKELFTPKSGLEVLPSETQTVLFILDSFKLNDYKLVGRLADQKLESLNLQRINESAWPVRSDSTSKNIIGYTAELKDSAGIKIIVNVNNLSYGTH